jgi:ribonuclease E
MTVVDVNTGKFTGSGGNLEQTVTKNNLEAAEEIVRQLRLRDIGGIIVIDFIDMVLEDNRDLVLRRLVECLGRDRTRHQVAEVTSLGLVQMTRKRISTGLIEAFSHPCEVCQGRGVVIEQEPVVGHKSEESHRPSSGSAANGSPRGSKRSSNRRRGGKSGGGDDTAEPVAAASTEVAPAAAEPAGTPPPPAVADVAGSADSAATTPDRNGADGAAGAEGAPVLTDVTVGP